MGTWHQMDGGMGMAMALWGLMGSLMILGMVIALLRWTGPAPAEFRAHLPDEPNRARSLLDERFARGEIDEEEYRKRRQLLSE